MNWIQRLGLRMAGITPQAAKAAYDYVPVGVRGKPVRSQYDRAALIRASHTNEVAYSCINIKQTTAVDPRLYVERKQSGDEWQEVEGHPLRRLMMKPNPDMDEVGFVQWFIASRDTVGEFYAEIVRSTKTGPPVALYPLNPALVDPIPASDGTIGAYQFKLGSYKQDIPAENMLVWRSPDISNTWRGLSPLAVATGAIDGDTAQTDYVSEFFKVGGIPAGMMTIKGRTVTALEAEEIRDKWRAKFSAKYGGSQTDIAVMDENAEFQVLGSKLDELASEELRGVAESRICMVFGVPPLVIYAYIGLLRSIQSNLREAWQQFWDSRLTPEYKAIRQWLTMRMLTEFESEDLVLGERVRCQWDMSQVAALQDDVDGIQARARDNWKAGGITRNEFRAAIGAQPDPDGDIYINDINAPAIASDDTNEGDDDEASPKVARKSIQHKAIDDIDRRREKIVGKARPKVEQYLLTEYEDASDRIKRDGVDAATTGADDGERLQATMQPFYRLAMRAAYDDTNELLVDQDISVSFNLENPNVRRTLNALLLQLKKDIPDTTKEDIRNVIAQGLNEGWSVDRISDELRAAAPGMSRNRSDAIARTEVARAHSRGALLSYEESGVVSAVEWNATLDGKTSEICTALNGRRASLADAQNGAFDGFSGPPAHPNCRSVLIPIVD